MLVNRPREIKRQHVGDDRAVKQRAEVCENRRTDGAYKGGLVAAEQLEVRDLAGG
jgi:hypothetical protein